MSDPGPRGWEWGGQGGYEDVRGTRGTTNAPPGGGPGAASDLPDSIKTLVSAIDSLKGVINTSAGQNQQMSQFMAMMMGKSMQGQAMFGGAMFPGGFPGFGSPHQQGNATVPNVRAYFPDPGNLGSYRSMDNPMSMRGTGRPGSMPMRGSVTGIRARAARAISTNTSVFGTRLESFANPDTGEIETYRHTGEDTDGTPKYEKVNPADVPRLQKRERVESAVQTAMGRAITGEGLKGVTDIAGALIPDAAAGPVGWAIGGATVAGEVGLQAAHLVANQRAKNAQYQSIMGGSNFAGFGQRIQSTMFGIRNAFTLGSGQAQEAFMGATQMGMRGNERNNALNMAVSAFNSMGMSVSQSLAAMNIQAQSGYENFTALEQSLKGVTAAAKETSQNADAVRQSFINTLGAVTQNVGGGAGTNTAAAAISTMQAGLGRQFANVNFSGLTDQNRLYMMASNAGQGINQFLANATTNPNVLTSGINRLQNQFLGNLGGQQAVANALKTGYKPGANGKLGPAQIASLTERVQSQYAPEPEIAAILQQALGVDTSSMSPEAVLQMYTNYLVGNTQLQGQNPAGPQAVTGAGRAALQQAFSPAQAAQSAATSAAGGGALTAATYTTQAIGAAAKKAGISVGSLSGSQGKLREAYLKQVGQTGSNSTIIDQLLRDKSNWGKLYTVQTANGGQATVSFQDLITNYSDQAASGGVTFATGKDASGQSLAGTSVASKYGGPSDDAAYAQAGKAASAQQALKGKDLSKQAQDWETKQQGKSTKGNNITISATPQLQQLFGFALNGQSITASTSTSLTPVTGNVNSENLAGSSPATYGSS
jgi:hypothetical protein